MSTGQRSRSAMLVAACRVVAAESPLGRQLCTDPFARLFVDDDALSAARENPALARSVWLRTRYIDDAVVGFVREHPGAQVIVLGAGNDARSVRLGVDARFFEIDRWATVQAKDATLAGAGVATPNRATLAVDLGRESFEKPLLAAGFDPGLPALAVWEGVAMYLDDDAVRSTAAGLATVVAAGGRVVVDYVRRRSFAAGFQGENARVGPMLASGGEPLAAGVIDVPDVLAGAGFEVIDDAAVENLLPRYGLAPVDRREMPLRILTAVRG